MTNMQRDKQSEIQELQKQNQYLLQNLNELREHMVNLSGGFTMLQQSNTHKEQQWAQQQNDINQRLTSLQQAIPPHSSQTRAAVVLAPSTAALGACNPTRAWKRATWQDSRRGLRQRAGTRPRRRDASAQPRRAGGLEPQGSQGPSKGPIDPSHSIKWQEWREHFLNEHRDAPLHTPRFEYKSP